MPFFFLRLLEATVASVSSLGDVEEDAEGSPLFPPPALAGLVLPFAGCVAPVWISFTCCGGGKAWPLSSLTLGFSSLGSAGAALGFNSFGFGEAAAGEEEVSVDAELSAEAAASAGVGVSERGAG